MMAALKTEPEEDQGIINLMKEVHPEKNYEPVYIIENPNQAGRYHLTYNHQSYEQVVRLDETRNEFGVIIEIIQDDHEERKYRLDIRDISYQDGEKEVKIYSNNKIKARRLLRF